jgi:anti-sigma regulatory factor (Ser/Thr protein kinase)
VSIAARSETPTTTHFRHEAAFYRGLDDFVATVLPFVREGIDNGEPIMVALPTDRIQALEAALGDDATRVDFVDMEQLGANPARIIPEWRRFLEDCAEDGPVRGVSEPLWSGRRPPEVEEAELHEALLNLAFDDGPAWRLMCPFDLEALPREVVEEAARNHPVAVAAAPVAVEYGGHGHAREAFSAPLPAPPAGADVFAFGPEDLSGLRSVVGRLSDQAGMRHEAADDMVLAAHELATNSIRHGGGEGTLRAWTQPDAFVVEVSDRGVIEDPLVGRDVIDELSENGRGVWMANQLCDLVQVRSGGSGTVVRLFAWL